MRSVDYIICAAGEGQRLRAVAGGTPKPLVQVHGLTCLERAISSLQLAPNDRLVIVVQAKHKIRETMSAAIEQRVFPNPVTWVELERSTKGQLETALCAKEHLRSDASVVIFNADTAFSSARLGSMLLEDWDGIIPCFRSLNSAETHFSFCEVDSSGKVIEVAEKRRISDWASIGFYHFGTTSLFLNYADKELRIQGPQEKYVIPVYGHMIHDGLRVVMCPVEAFRPMGTPEELRVHWQWSERSSGKKTLVVDLDGTLTVDDLDRDYASKVAQLELIRKLHEYKALGFEIIIYTSRRMRTCQRDEGKVVAMTGEETMRWLRDHNVPFDGLRFGKPYCENGFMIDDRAIRPAEFLKFELGQIMDLLARDSRL